MSILLPGSTLKCQDVVTSQAFPKIDIMPEATDLDEVSVEKFFLHTHLSSHSLVDRHF